MNKWKVAFFLLLFLIIISIVGLFVWATSPSEDLSVPSENHIQTETDSIVQVELTAKDFEKIVNKMLKEELDAFQLKVTTQVELLSELQVFGITVPISMYFDPEVKEDGNIQLKQTSVNVGKLNLPPETVLKIMNDSIDFPNWISIRPDSNVIDIDLTKVKLLDGLMVKAKEIDLEQNQILLEIILSDD